MQESANYGSQAKSAPGPIFVLTYKLTRAVKILKDLEKAGNEEDATATTGSSQSQNNFIVGLLQKNLM